MSSSIIVSIILILAGLYMFGNAMKKRRADKEKKENEKDEI